MRMSIFSTWAARSFLRGAVEAVDAGDLLQDPADLQGNRACIFGAVSQVLTAAACSLFSSAATTACRS
ncbi:MAG: hypothetical protein R3D63_13370 [Paracoccaceae bacterium]